MSKTTTLSNFKRALFKAVQEDRLSMNDLLEFIKECGMYANIQSVRSYAEQEGISPQAAAQSKYVVKLWGKKFIARND